MRRHAAVADAHTFHTNSANRNIFVLLFIEGINYGGGQLIKYSSRKTVPVAAAAAAAAMPACMIGGSRRTFSHST